MAVVCLEILKGHGVSTDCTRETTRLGISSFPKEFKAERGERRGRTVKTMKCDRSGVEESERGKGKGRGKNLMRRTKWTQVAK